MPKEDKVLMERLVYVKGLTASRDAVEKFIVQFEPQRDTCQVSVRLEFLDRLFQQFTEAEDAIERLDKPEALEAHLEERVEFEQRYFAAKGFLLSKLRIDTPSQQLNQSMSVPHSTNMHLRLPKIDLPRFNGDFSLGCRSGIHFLVWFIQTQTFQPFVNCSTCYNHWKGTRRNRSSR